jgi:hypothetical protein
MSKFSEFSNKKQLQISSLTFKLSMLYNAQESRSQVKGLCKQELRNVANEWCYLNKMILSFMLKI